MQTLLAEQPLVLSLILGVLAVSLIYGWLQTGRTGVGVSALLVAALIPLAWVIAEYWVTDREQIRMLIYETAAAIESNEHERTLDLIADPTMRLHAANELDRWIFDEARVTGIRQIEVIAGAVPKEADVDMLVRVTVAESRGGMRAESIPRRIRLRLQQQGENWRIIAYDHMPPVGGPDQYSRGLP